jgi:hypothetical protein
MVPQVVASSPQYYPTIQAPAPIIPRP